MNDKQHDPFELFASWFSQASQHQDIIDHTAMTLATVSKTNMQPSSRIVLLKQFNENGFVFYSNYQSRKAKEIETNPNAALLFWWPPLGKQIRIEGTLKKLTEEESIAYFKSRPYGSQIGAWVSKQSSVIPNREFLDSEYDKYKNQYKENEVPKPDYWGGYCLVPNYFEFWSAGYHRLHDRIIFILEDNHWKQQRLAP